MHDLCYQYDKASCGRSDVVSDFRTLFFRELIIDEFVPSDLAVVQFTQRKV